MIKLKPVHLFPGHGPMIADASGLLDRYIQHRRARENQVEDLLLGSELPISSDAVVGALYTGTPPERIWMAKENVQKVLRKFVRAESGLAAPFAHRSRRSGTAAGPPNESVELRIKALIVRLAPDGKDVRAPALRTRHSARSS